MGRGGATVSRAQNKRAPVRRSEVLKILLFMLLLWFDSLLLVDFDGRLRYEKYLMVHLKKCITFGLFCGK